jgi:hypothetical protein
MNEMTGIRGFFEYRIDPAKRDQYLRLVPRILSLQAKYGLSTYEIIESMQRENQFVETFRVESMDAYRRIEEKLNTDEAFLACQQERDACIIGGRATMKVWFFRDIEQERGGK